MNVYIVEVSRRLAARGIDVDIFTRATSSDLPPVVEMAPGRDRAARQRRARSRVWARKSSPASSAPSPPPCCARRPSTSRATTTSSTRTTGCPARSAGWPATGGACRSSTPRTPWPRSRTRRWPTATGPEPRARVIGEEQVVAEADRLIANTDEEARQLVRLYDADPARTLVVPPGVDLDRFAPGDRAAARRAVGVPGRRPRAALRRPHPAAEGPRRPAARRRRAAGRRPGAARAAARARRRRAQRLRPGRPATSCRSSPATLGIADVVRFFPPQPPDRLAEHYRAADVAVVPSHNESFGLVALEAQACGTPVVAAAVGGLRTAVRDGVSGVLVDGHDPRRLRARPCAPSSPAGSCSPPGPAGTPPCSPGTAPPTPSSPPTPSAAEEMAGVVRPSRPRLAARPAARPARACRSPDERAASLSELDEVIEQALRDSDLVHEHPAPGRWLVDLPGTKKLKTVCGLIVGEHALRVEAFVCRQPDENREQLWTFLLQHNARMYGVAYSIDGVGDVYLTGRLPHAAVTPRGDRPHPRRRPQLRRRPLQRDARDRLRHLDPPRVGLAGQARGVAAATSRRSPPSPTPPAARTPTPLAAPPGHGLARTGRDRPDRAAAPDVLARATRGAGGCWPP